MKLTTICLPVLIAGALLVPSARASALSSPTDLLEGFGIDPYRDLDGQTPNDPDVAYVTEDTVRSFDGYVGPGVGGQKYDWEGLFTWRTQDEIVLVLSTGFRLRTDNPSRLSGSAPSSPDSGAAGVNFNDGRIYAGDVLVDLNIDGTWDLGISLGAYTDADGRGGLDYGVLYSIDQTAGYAGTGTYRAGYDEGSPWIGAADEILAALDFSTEIIWVEEQAGEDMNGDDRTRARHLAAFSIDLGAYPEFLGSLAWHWTMECGNDVGEIGLPPPSPPPPVPEPTTVLLLGAATAGLGWWRRRRRRA